MSPASPDELKLHHRLLIGDETASAELFAHYMDWLVDTLRACHPRIAEYDEALVLDAVTDALFDYIRRPEIYRPDLKSLKNFLYMSATCDLLNQWRKVSEAAKLETSLDELVELGLRIGNSVVGEGSDPERILDKIVAAELWQQIQTIVPEEKDLQVVALMSLGVRETSAYAEVLGITDLPEAEQRRQVKRVKDRLKKRLQRADWGQFDGRETDHGKQT